MRIFAREALGATSVEYAIMAALVAVVIIAGVGLLGTNMGSLYDCAATKVESMPGDVDC